jgi:3-oxoacyl-[acyl-carrier protein] reductase
MKKVLVTGSTGALGEAIARYYHDHGYFVYLHYRSAKDKAVAIHSQLENSEIIGFDIIDKEDMKVKLENLEVDVLVNNAGIIKDKLFFFMEDEDWEEVISTNLNGYYYVTKQILKNMIKNKAGSIVNVTSVSGLVGNAGQTNYSASKGGIIAFTKALCTEVGRYGIRVNAIAPGVIKSDMAQKVDKNIAKMIPAGRLGEPSEVAEVAFFLGDKATYVNGEVINISGGMVR